MARKCQRSAGMPTVLHGSGRDVRGPFSPSGGKVTYAAAEVHCFYNIGWRNFILGLKRPIRGIY